MGMELNTILELVKAGFTKDEILQMKTPTETKPDEPKEEPKAEPEQMKMELPVSEPTPTPTPTPTPEQTQPSMADIMQSIAKLTSAVQANAIAQSNIPAGIMNPPSAEDMLAEIIRPTIKERM